MSLPRERLTGTRVRGAWTTGGADRRRTRRAVTAVGLAVALLTAHDAGADQAGPTLVMPFERAGDDTALYWLGEGAAILLADDLNALAASALTRPERVDAFDLLGLPPSASLSRATVIKIGEVLGTSAVVIGSVEIQDGMLTVRARRIEVAAGRMQDELVESGPLSDLFAAFERLARRLAVPASGGADVPPLERHYPPIEAFESYVKGLVSETPSTEVRFFERALELYPRYDRARLALWQVHSEQGDHAAALEAARAVSDASPFARRARFSEALTLVDLHRYDEAFSMLKSLLDAQPSAALLNAMGVLQLRRGGSPDDGMPTYFFTKAADLEPGSADFAFNVGYAYTVAGDAAAASYWLREAVRRDPADADAHFVLGLALDGTGHPVEAARERALAAQLSARYADRAAETTRTVPLGLERLLRRVETPRAARLDGSVVGVAQQEQRSLAEFHLDRGRRYVETEQDRAAIPELRRAIYLSPYLAEAHLLLGRVYLRAGRARDAIDALKIAIWSEETAPAHVALAEAYVQVEDARAARIELERALQLDPASSDARRLLDGLDRGGGQVAPGRPGRTP